MRYSTRILVFTVLTLALAACEQSPTRPDVRPSLSSAGEGTVVTNEAELAAALAAAKAGDVIVIEGMIEVTSEIEVSVGGITLKGKDSGSGLFTAFGSGLVGSLIWVSAHNVTVEKLMLDAEFAGRDGALTASGRGMTFKENDVVCSQGGCVLFSSAPMSTITDNHFRSVSSEQWTGVHVQLSDGTQVAGNTVVAEETTPPSNFGAIRVAASSRVVVTDNTVMGPWFHGLAIHALDKSVIEDNEISGAQSVGIRLTASTADNLVKDNRISAIHVAGLSCRDLSTGGGTAGTANEWVDNKTEAPSSPAGICGG